MKHRSVYRTELSPISFLERSAAWWELTRDHLWRGRSVFAVEAADGRITGYLAYRQLEGEYTALGGPFKRAVDEILWTEREAGLALWGLLASWAPAFVVITIVTLRKSALRPLLSVSVPWSITCSSKLKTSGCAFSISSNSNTQ